MLASMNDGLEEALHEVAAWATEAERQAVAEGLRSARAVWPALKLPLEPLADYLRARVSQESRAALGSERVRDLALAFACAEGQAEAVRVFDQHVLRAVAPAVRALKQGPDFVDEVMQRARERLLVGPADGRKRIAEYNGSGSLLRWVRVLVVRIALQLLRDRDLPLPSDDGAAPAGGGRDPERDHLQARYGAWFKQAVKRAFAELAEEDRALLEMLVRERLSLSEIGARLGVNKSTISRRVTAIRVAVFDGIQSLAREELRLGAGEYASVIRLIQSQLDMSLGLFS
jgi:RNA polymerase sigma-70 factor, ECF subfamily